MKIRLTILSLLALVLTMSARAQFLPITANHIVNSANQAYTGRLCFTPTYNGASINFYVAGGQQATGSTACFNVNSGVLQSGVELADVAVSSPAYFCYRVTIRNGADKFDDGVLYPCYQPSSTAAGSNVLDNAIPGAYGASLIQTGPRGAQGIPGNAASIQIGSVTTLAQGLSAAVQNVGDSTNAILNIGLPLGGASLAQVQSAATSATFGGNHLGAKADNGNSERHFFDLRSSGDWDAVSGTPTFKAGTFAASSSGPAKMARSFIGGFGQESYTVQAVMSYSSASSSVNFVGVNTSAAGTISSTFFTAVGFEAGNFVSFSTSPTTLVPASSLVSGSLYVVSLTCEDGVESASLTLLGGTGVLMYQVPGGCPANAVNMEVESDTTSDMQFADRYAVSASDTLTIPATDNTYGFAWGFEQEVASNPSGSNVNVYALIPSSYRVGTPQPWVLFNHGAGLEGYAIMSGIENNIMNVLVKAGYVVVASDYTNNECWGNIACTEDIATEVANFQAHLNLAPHPYVIMESMGGLVTLNSIAKGTLSPKAVVGIYPVVSLATLYGSGSGYGTSDYAPYIQTAYGFSSSAGYAAATAGYDPSLDPITTFAGIPFFIECSPSDTVVPCSVDGQGLVNSINTAGGSAIYSASSGNHGDASNFTPAVASQVVAFFNSH